MEINNNKLNEMLPTLQKNCDGNINISLENSAQLANELMEYSCETNSVNFSAEIQIPTDKYWLRENS